MACFLPDSKKENLVADFEKLKQTPGMSVIEYDMAFKRLSPYTFHLVALKD